MGKRFFCKIKNLEIESILYEIRTHLIVEATITFTGVVDIGIPIY
jgi:hypothetical protein